MTSAIVCLAVALLLVAEVQTFNPGDAVDGIRMRTMDQVDFKADRSLIVTAVDRSDAFSSNMFLEDSSLAAILQHSPPTGAYLFVSHAGNATANAVWMRQQLLDAAARLQLADSAMKELFSRLHFAADSVADIGGWLAPLLDEWTTPRKLLKANITAAPENKAEIRRGLSAESAELVNGAQGECRVDGIESTRLDAFYSWLPWPATGVKGPLVSAGGTCAFDSRSALKGAVALIALSGPSAHSGTAEVPCPGFGELLMQLQGAGAIAAVFAAPAGQHMYELNCSSTRDCGLPVAIPATMVPHSTGWRLQRAWHAGCRIEVELGVRRGPGLHAGLDASGRLFEVGWPVFPSLVHTVWAAQWQDYLERLQRRLEDDSALVVPVFEGVNMTGEHGVRVEVTLPQPRLAQYGSGTIGRYNRLELDMELGCPGTRDRDCPAWDHAVQLFVCCNDPGGGALPPCPACRPTVWAQPQRSIRSALCSSVPASSSSSVCMNGSGGGSAGISGGEELECGWELGRWMTPFRRRVGRWVTDASHLLPLLLPDAAGAGERRCTFTTQSTAWAGTWKPSLRLRLSSDQHRSRRGHQREQAGGSFLLLPGSPRPAAATTTLLPLPFNGGIFDADYNLRRKPFTFSTPAGLQQAVVVALISGHGSDENNCAEFCPTEHIFEVNGRLHALNFTDAGTLWGCADRVADGVVPNEHGTWQYGRGGWCNGNDVKQWVADITADLVPPGSGAVPNTMRYYGLFQGKDPAPRQQPGYIMMSASLVLYTAQPAVQRQ